jgi:hypothetical protein
MEDNKPSVITVRDEEGRLHHTSPDSEIAKRAAEREAAEAAEVPEPPRGGTGSGVDAWRDYADKTGVEVTDDMTRDNVIAAVDLAREEADAAEPSGSGDDRDAGTDDSGSGDRE